MGKSKNRYERCRCPVFNGVCTVRCQKLFSLAQIKSKLAKAMKLCKKVKCYLSDYLAIMIDNYAITMIVMLLLLALFIPFVTKAIHDSSETKALRKIVSTITREVAQAQMNYKDVVDEFSYLQSSVHDIKAEANLCQEKVDKETNMAAVQCTKSITKCQD